MSHMKRISTGTTLLVALIAGTACSDATAMARRQPADEGASIPVETPARPADPEPLIAGSYQKGYQLGKRNGGIIVQRLRDRTIGTQGCTREAVSELQDALVQVTRSIRPPGGGDDALVSGFFSGYLDSVRKGIRDARTSCQVRKHASGGFAGQLYGALLCQATSVSLELVKSLQIESLYEGWSGGSDTVLEECRTAATLTLKDCVGSLNDVLEISVEQSCSDPLGSE